MINKLQCVLSLDCKVSRLLVGVIEGDVMCEVQVLVYVSYSFLLIGSKQLP